MQLHRLLTACSLVSAILVTTTSCRLPGVVSAQPAVEPSAEAIVLRNLGLARLENEKPLEAATAFRRLTMIADREPLGFANLAIALLRQQDTEAALFYINLGLIRAPDRPDLLVIKADILAWTGDSEAALGLYRQAAEGNPEDPQLLYALVRHAGVMASEAASEVEAWADERLVRLRPENLVVLLRRGQRAIRAGDRSTASEVFLRVRELLWQVPAAAHGELDKVLEALEIDDVGAARVPALRLGNVLRSTPIYRSSLVELQTGIQGMPVERLLGEPAPTAFGDGLEVTFRARVLDLSPTVGRALVVADLDGDERPDSARLIRLAAGGYRLEIRRAAASEPLLLEAPAHDRLRVADLDNDGRLDLIAFGGQSASGAQLATPHLATLLPVSLWRGLENGGVEPAAGAQSSGAQSSGAISLGSAGAEGLDVLDYDSEGDLDVALAGHRVDLYRNNLVTPFERPDRLEAVGELSLPKLELAEVTDLLATDLDRDGDTDLVIAHRDGVTWLDNLRQGRFRDRTADSGLDRQPPSTVVSSADIDNDGRPELVLGGQRLLLLRADGGDWREIPAPEIRGAVADLAIFDADNDGRLDLAVAGDFGIDVFVQRDAGWQRRPVEGAQGPFSAVVHLDVDLDGDLDLLAGGAGGLVLLENEGGNRNHWLTVRLRGLDKGNDKNNLFGRGATVEVRVGEAYQFREVRTDVTHLGLGRHRRADSLRVVWNNGIPQHRMRPEALQRVVEEQVLKGSCPFLYTWNGERIEFVTDLLWGAPLGMPVAPGAWAASDPTELVRVDGAVPHQGLYDLRITEELWEAAYFDRLRLWVVDHPAGSEVASSLRIFPQEPPPGGLDDGVRTLTELRALAAAWDGRGREVSARVAHRDDVYADGYPIGDYQGIAARPWSFTLDLGEAPGRAVRLVLDGWIFPADASLNLAAAQRPDLDFTFTRLEVETPSGWHTLLDPMGFPAGKTKTMVVDTPPLPQGARRLRIVTSRWLHWDRIAWTLTRSQDDRAQVVARLEPSSAELSYRGFSRLLRRAPNAPHEFVYGEVTPESPWLPFPGHYTRYGNVTELLQQADDRLVILAAGDEMRVLFDANTLPPAAFGTIRTLFLESLGWDKDADRNTYRADGAQPLPFRAMSGYPYSEPYPQTEELETYRREWLTREIGLR